jgi:hypothetical protein
MENQQVFVRILNPKRVEHLLSEFSLHSVRIVIEHQDVSGDLFGCIDDDWGIMLAHLWRE